MTTVSTENNSAISQSLLNTMNGSGQTAKTEAEETEDRFLKLLVEQMKNQDPLNPMENAQVTSQMAQLSTVTGIDKLNETMASMINSVQSGQSYQAASMIGHNVLVPGDKITNTGTGGIFGVDVGSDADTIAIEIKDAGGDVVKTINMSKADAGINAVQWDGTMDDGEKAPDGNYTFSSTAKLGSTDITSTTLAFATVNSVSTDSSGVKLNLSNQDAVSMSDVKEIF